MLSSEAPEGEQFYEFPTRDGYSGPQSKDPAFAGLDGRSCANMWHQGESRPAQWSIHVVLDRVGPVLHGPYRGPAHPERPGGHADRSAVARKSRTARSFSESSAGGLPPVRPSAAARGARPQHTGEGRRYFSDGLPLHLDVCGLFCVSGPAVAGCCTGSVGEQVAQARVLSQLQQRQHVPRAGPHQHRPTGFTSLFSA